MTEAQEPMQVPEPDPANAWVPPAPTELLQPAPAPAPSGRPSLGAALGLLAAGLVVGALAAWGLSGGSSSPASAAAAGPAGGAQLPGGVPGGAPGQAPGGAQGGVPGGPGGRAGETHVVGTVASVSGDSLSVTTQTGTSTYTVTASTEVIRNGAPSTLSALQKGDPVVVHVLSDGSVERVLAGMPGAPGGGAGAPPATGSNT